VADDDDDDKEAVVVVSLDEARGKRKPKKRGGGSSSGGGGDGPSTPYPEEKDCPVKCLGMVGNDFAFLTPSGRLTVRSYRDLSSPIGLAGLFDGTTTWLRQHYAAADKPSGYVSAPAAIWLMRHCVQHGFFRPENDLRGAGAWRLNDGGLLLHQGNEVVVVRERRSLSGGGARIAYESNAAGIRYGAHIYPAARPEQAAADEAASADEVKELFDVLSTWSFQHHEDARVLLGWIGCAFICGALEHRPHVWVTGDTETGKSTLDRLIRALIGNSAMNTVDATKMGIAQTLQGAARPVFIDEMERQVDPTRQSQIVELARISYSDDEASIVRGGPGGHGWSLRIRACLYVSGIVPAPLKPAERNRIHVLDLGALAPGSVERVREIKARIEHLSKHLGPRLRARVIESFWRFQRNEAVLEQAIMETWKRSGRVVDQLGTLLAMSFALLLDNDVSLEMAKTALANFDVTTFVGRQDQAEAPQCIDHLLTIPISYQLEGKPGLQLTNMAELISEVVALMPSDGASLYQGAQHRELKRHGVALVRDKADVLGIVVASDHQGLAPLFEGTRWNGGVWGAILKRLKGAYQTKKPVRFTGLQRYGTFVPLSSIPMLIAQNDKSEDRIDEMSPAEISQSDAMEA
jgi:hypothetical protein